MNSPKKIIHKVSSLERKERRYFYLFISPWLAGFFSVDDRPYDLFLLLCAV